MNKLKDQFAQVGRLLFGTETRDIFTAAVQRLVAIVVEMLRLGWMLFCLIFLLFVWGGAATRRAVDTIATLPARLAERAEQAKQQPTEQRDLVASTKQALSSMGTSSATFAIAQAKSQLGINTGSSADSSAESVIVSSDTERKIT